MNLLTSIAKRHTVPLQEWTAKGIRFKLFGDNLDKLQKARDQRIGHFGNMYHMYSVLAMQSRTPSTHLSITGHTTRLENITAASMLPSKQDIEELQRNLTVLVGRILTEYIPALSFLSSVVPAHIKHKFTNEMARKSTVSLIDVLMKNEANGQDMLEIMETLHTYLGKNYPHKERLLSGGDQLTCERQRASQRHVMCGNTPRERLEILEPVTEDWHTGVAFLAVSNEHTMILS